MSTSDDLRRLIDQMKSEETEHAITEALEAPLDEPVEEGVIEAVHPTAVREVFRQLALIKIQKAAIEKVERQLVAAGNAIIGDNRGVKADGERLAKHSTTTVTRINTEVVKELFPPEKYPQLYNTTEETRLLLDVEFKRTVFAEATKEQEIEA